MKNKYNQFVYPTTKQIKEAGIISYGVSDKNFDGEVVFTGTAKEQKLVIDTGDSLDIKGNNNIVPCCRIEDGLVFSIFREGLMEIFDIKNKGIFKDFKLEIDYNETDDTYIIEIKSKE